MAGDGFFLTFDGPARAIRFAMSLIESVESIGLQVRVGIHTGEVERAVATTEEGVVREMARCLRLLVGHRRRRRPTI